GLAQADTVTEEGTTMLARDLHESPVAFLLVPVENREHSRLALLPLARGDLVTLEELVQGGRVDIKRREEAGVPIDDGPHVARYILGGLPVVFEPGLKLRHLSAALYLDI